MKYIITEQQFSKFFDKLFSKKQEPTIVKNFPEEEQNKKLDKTYESYLNFKFKKLYEVFFENVRERFWAINGEIVVEKEIGRNLIIKTEIWEQFSNMFSLNYDETQQIMKEWFEKHLKLENIKPDYLGGMWARWINLNKEL